jgi:hypothetical protein
MPGARAGWRRNQARVRIFLAMRALAGLQSGDERVIFRTQFLFGAPSISIPLSDTAVLANPRRVYTVFMPLDTLLPCCLLDLVYASSRPEPLREHTTMDLLYIAGIALFWGLCVALAVGCEKLRRAPGGRP